ncbi:MAG: GNAT family N-acetyltransferase [Eubacteriales bacterium]|nr:GNAT family N-acetyltransferase [Eubacteriales bacterium]
MEIIYREATPGDAGALLDFLKIIGGESDNLNFGAEGLPFTVAQEEKFLEKNSSNAPGYRMLLALDGDNVVGSSTVEKYSSHRSAHRCQFSIAVRKSHWGKAIGSGLMERQLEFAKKAGAEIMQLAVRSDNVRAMGLYKKFSFVPFGTYPRFFKIGGAYFDAVYMTKSL